MFSEGSLPPYTVVLRILLLLLLLLLLFLLLLLLQVIPVKVNYNHFTVYKASSLNLKII